MTIVRRLNVSQVDGNGANDTNTNEIRPYGELAVYLGNNNKLELLMFDGVRTNLKSKVLNKGTFYGGDADSSDGAGYDSIKLVPDEFLRQEGSQQYLIIEPTGGQPGHVHIRAGGAIDSSSADLFLGGEKNHVRVSDVSDSVTISTDNGTGTNTWTFDLGGNLTFPNSIILNTAILTPAHSGDDESAVLRGSLDKNIYIETFTQSAISTWKFGSNGSLNVPGFITSNEVTGLKLASNYDVSIIADYTDNNIEWTFDGSTSTLIVPGPIKSKTNQQVGSQVTGLPYTLGAGADNGYVGIGPEWAVVVALGNLTGYTLTAQQTGSTIFTTTITQMRTDLGGSPAFQTAVGLPGYAADITFTLTSPDYVPASDNNLELEAGPDIWTFGANGTLMFPNSALVDSSDSNIEFRGMNNFNVEAGGVVNIVTDSTDTAQSWQFGDNGALTFPDTVSNIYTLNPATSGGVSGLNLTGNTRTYIGITGDPNFTWDFRNFGLADYSTNRKPAIMLPGSSWIEEDLTNQSLNLGMLGPLLIGSQDKLTLRTNSIDLQNNGFTPLATYEWVFGKDGSLTFPDDTVQTTAYPGITNVAGVSETLVVGGSDMTKDALSVRVVAGVGSYLDVEINYSLPSASATVMGSSTTVAFTQVSTQPLNIFGGQQTLTANNTTWTIINAENLNTVGDSVTAVISDKSFNKIYRVTVMARTLPDIAVPGDAYCTIEVLK